MADSTVTRIRYFEIVAVGHRVRYGRRYEEPVGDADYRDKVAAAVEAGALPGTHGDDEDVFEEVQSALRPTLDLEAASDEASAYVFRLNVQVANAGGQSLTRLAFAGPEPFVSIPLNSPGGEDFLTDFEVHDGATGQWASFVCDHHQVRESPLAGRIAKVLKGHDRVTLTIPFVFNFIDPVLGASPLTVPADDDEDPIHRSLLIHGGVHPDALASLAVQL